jgi:molybdopterin molybdotransferase
MKTLIEVEEARQIVLQAATPLGIEWVSLPEAVGRVLAEPVIAPHDLPPFDNAAMDGYAIRAADAPPGLPLRIVGEARAGRGYRAVVQPGEAVAISTGAPVPAGADAVVPLEEVERDETGIRLRQPVASGANIRPRGQDIQAGEPLLPSGIRIQPKHLGMLAALGFASLKVYQRARVATLVTGSELVPYNAPLAPDTIRDTNSLLLRWWLRDYPCTFGGIVPDDLEILRALLESSLRDAEVVVLTGGVSVGEHDLVKPALQAVGATVRFWRVNIKPGKPILFAQRGQQAIFGLPGNPLAVVVGMRLFVLPYLRTLEGETVAPTLPTLPARLAVPVHKKGGRAEFQTARLRLDSEGVLWVTPTPAQGSALLKSLAAADAFLYLPAGTRSYMPGDVVQILPLECGSFVQKCFST